VGTDIVDLARGGLRIEEQVAPIGDGEADQRGFRVAPASTDATTPRRAVRTNATNSSRVINPNRSSSSSEVEAEPHNVAVPLPNLFFSQTLKRNPTTSPSLSPTSSFLRR
jgi:hypothetical protein